MKKSFIHITTQPVALIDYVPPPVEGDDDMQVDPFGVMRIVNELNADDVDAGALVPFKPPSGRQASASASTFASPDSEHNFTRRIEELEKTVACLAESVKDLKSAVVGLKNEQDNTWHPTQGTISNMVKQMVADEVRRMFKYGQQGIESCGSTKNLADMEDNHEEAVPEPQQNEEVSVEQQLNPVPQQNEEAPNDEGRFEQASESHPPSMSAAKEDLNVEFHHNEGEGADVEKGVVHEERHIEVLPQSKRHDIIDHELSIQAEIGKTGDVHADPKSLEEIVDLEIASTHPDVDCEALLNAARLKRGSSKWHGRQFRYPRVKALFHYIWEHGDEERLVAMLKIMPETCVKPEPHLCLMHFSYVCSVPEITLHGSADNFAHICFWDVLNHLAGDEYYDNQPIDIIGHFSVNAKEGAAYYIDTTSSYEILKYSEKARNLQRVSEFAKDSVERHLRHWAAADIIYWPLNWMMKHFFLCVIRMKEGVVEVWDTWENNERATRLKYVRKLMKSVAPAIDHCSIELKEIRCRNWGRFQVRQMTECPLQEGNDCGAWVSLFLLDGVDKWRSQPRGQQPSHAEIRFRVALELMRKDKWKEDEYKKLTGDALSWAQGGRTSDRSRD